MEFLISMIDSLKVAGYTPDISNLLFDIEEEEESTLDYHGEKLASWLLPLPSFGLLTEGPLVSRRIFEYVMTVMVS